MLIDLNPEGRGAREGVEPSSSERQNAVDLLAGGLRESVQRCVAGDPAPTILLSGGLDSALVGWLARGFSPHLSAITVGTAKSADPTRATEAAHLLGIPITAVLVAATDVQQALADFGEEIDPLAEPLRSVALAVVISLRNTRTHRVLCGQGADELFLGYAHFRGLSPDECIARRERDWQLLIDSEWPRACRIASRLDRDLRSPYLDKAFSRAVLDAPIAEHLPGSSTKPLLRLVAARLGLPSTLAQRPKRAWQYGSGVQKLARTSAARPP